jgi:DNA-directed RNA polymerase subunit E'/Rpb7
MGFHLGGVAGKLIHGVTEDRCEGKIRGVAGQLVVVTQHLHVEEHPMTSYTGGLHHHELVYGVLWVRFVRSKNWWLRIPGWRSK